MMKLLSATLLLTLLSSFTVRAADLFREVVVHTDTWEVTFHEKGMRYLLFVDGVERGTSGYLQRMRLLKNEKLRLVERHIAIDVSPVNADGKHGVELTIHHEHWRTKDKSPELRFEPVHAYKPEPAEPAPVAK